LELPIRFSQGSDSGTLPWHQLLPQVCLVEWCPSSRIACSTLGEDGCLESVRQEVYKSKKYKYILYFSPVPVTHVSIHSYYSLDLKHPPKAHELRLVILRESRIFKRWGLVGDLHVSGGHTLKEGFGTPIPFSPSLFSFPAMRWVVSLSRASTVTCYFVTDPKATGPIDHRLELWKLWVNISLFSL
jgi:hypothetical protein